MRSVAGALFFFTACAVPAVNAGIGLTALIAVGSWNGVAIDGYDPVAYYTDGKARVGSDTLEVVWRDAVWRFANEGNRAAFEAHPQVYAPRFGGFDPNGVAQGLLVKGNALIFARGEDDKLYLFKDEASRDVFLDNDQIVAKAATSWDDLVVKVVP